MIESTMKLTKTPEQINAVTTLGGRKLPYRIITSKRARRLRLSVTSQEVTVTLPVGVKPGDAEKFLQQNAQWLLHQLERAAKTRPAGNVLPPDVIYFRGIATRIEIIDEAGRLSRMRIDEERGRLVLRVPPGTRGTPRSIIEPWLKQQARQEIEQMVKASAARMKVSPKKVTIRDQRTRWGSCSNKGTLSFNWRLIMAPPIVMEYVVIHELAHLRQPNHSTAFWDLVAAYAPAYKKSRLWLKKNGAALRPDNQ